MFHMYAIPGSTADSRYSGRFRVRYLTKNELNNSGSARSIHCHAEVAEIALVYCGRGVHSIGSRRYNSEPGDLLLYNTNILHQDLSSTEEEPVQFFLCAVSGLQIAGQMPGVLTADPDCFLLKSGIYGDFLLKGFQVLEQSLQERAPNVAAMAQGFAEALLAIVTGLSANGRKADSPHAEEVPLVEKIRGYIDYNYTSNFSLAELAEALHISRYHASHIFSEAYGVSIIHYRTLRRIGEAQSLLTSSDESITRIASNVGYDDPNQFSQTFAKIVGMPPSKYRSLSVWSRRSYTGKKETP